MSLGYDTRDDERIADLRGEVMRAIDRCIDQDGDEEDILAVLAHAFGETTAAFGRRSEISHLLIAFADSAKTFHFRAVSRRAEEWQRSRGAAST